jgi:hypothetical protein
MKQFTTTVARLTYFFDKDTQWPVDVIASNVCILREVKSDSVFIPHGATDITFIGGNGIKVCEKISEVRRALGFEPEYNDNNGTLIVCKDNKQMIEVQRAFGHDADYITYWSAVCGRRYHRIIVFKTNSFESDIQRDNLENLIQVDLKTRLYVNDGEIIVIDC